MPLLRSAKPLDDEAGLHLLTLDLLVIRKLGVQALMWESPVLRDEMVAAFGEIGPVTWERIQAARCMHLRESFWTEWEVFENCALAICGRPVNFGFMQPLEAEELAVAVRTAERIDSRVYSEDVKRYIAASCLHDGLWYTEPPLEPLVGPFIKEYFEARRNPMNGEAVKDILASRSTIDDKAEDPVEVQANRTLSVREVLASYDRELAEQLARLPALLGESR